MNRIDLITETIVNQYLNEAPKNLHAYSSGGWPPCVSFTGSYESGLTKQSIKVPRSWIKTDGTVTTDRVVELLYKSVRRDISRGLGYYCGTNIYGKFEIFFKRSTNVFYFRHDWEKLLNELFLK